jgi:hypothetical protein
VIYTFIAKDGRRFTNLGLGEVYGLFVEYGNPPAEALRLCGELVKQGLAAQPATSEEIAAADELTALTQEMGLYRPATSEGTEA